MISNHFHRVQIDELQYVSNADEPTCGISVAALHWSKISTREGTERFHGFRQHHVVTECVPPLDRHCPAEISGVISRVRSIRKNGWINNGPSGVDRRPHSEEIAIADRVQIHQAQQPDHARYVFRIRGRIVEDRRSTVATADQDGWTFGTQNSPSVI